MWITQYSDYDRIDYEEEERQQHNKHCEHLRSLSNEDLGKEYQRESDRHDSAVDRCEAINSPTIEDAQGWMDIIERIFKERGVNSFDFIFPDDKV